MVLYSFNGLTEIVQVSASRQIRLIRQISQICQKKIGKPKLLTKRQCKDLEIKPVAVYHNNPLYFRD